jgi:hypothetical protein
MLDRIAVADPRHAGKLKRGPGFRHRHNHNRDIERFGKRQPMGQRLAAELGAFRRNQDALVHDRSPVEMNR